MGPVGGFSLLTLIGESDGPESSALSPRELAQAEFMLSLGTEERYEQELRSLNSQSASLRSKDSLYSKLGRFSASRVMDAATAEAARLDVDEPRFAPHTAIFGPRFPQDGRAPQVKGTILGVTSGQVTDVDSVFGDPYWGEIQPSERLAGRYIRMKSGALRGSRYLITTHEIEGSGYIVIEGNPIGPTHVGDKFVIDGPGIPDIDVDRDDAGGDWMVVSAITGTFAGISLGNLVCEPVFHAGGYWQPNGTAIPGTLVGRDVIIEGVGTRKIIAHDTRNLLSGGAFITVDDMTGVTGNEAFKIAARSPFDTGRQHAGTLTSAHLLEPTVQSRLSPRSLGRASELSRAELKEGATGVNRYRRLRFHRFTGSAMQLRFFRRGAVERMQQVLDEQKRADDIKTMTERLGLPLEVDE